MTSPGRISFDHLDRLSDDRGLFEHAEFTERREQHGYCTDDNARLLVVASREPDVGSARRLSRLALTFVLDSQEDDGKSHNRMDRTGVWTDKARTNDAWGRALWGLGVAAARHGDSSVRSAALTGFELGARARSRWPRAMAFAALGAVELLVAHPDNAAARSVLADAITAIGPLPSGPWVWPEPRLGYANAAMAEALIGAGVALGDDGARSRGLAMLGWLLDLETVDGHLSVTGVGGRGPAERGMQFDQQSIEVAALADACGTAFDATGDARWSKGVALAADWFRGANDAGLTMFDEESGGGYDGLHRDGVNLNQGAESTLAYVATMQRARLYALAS